MPTRTIVNVGGTGNLPATSELPVDMWSKRMSAMAALTPLTVILSKLSQESAHNFRVDLIEEFDMPTTVDIAQTEASAGVTIYVTAYGTSLVKDTLLFNPRTEDLRLVDSTPTDNTVTVTISQGGTTSAIWKTGDTVFVLPPALAENDESFRAASVKDENVYNYIQLCKLQFSITRLENKMTTHFGGPGSKRAQLKRQKYREFRKKAELLKMFGGRASSGTAPATKYFSGGLMHFLNNGTLYKDFNGIFTETGYDNYLGEYLDENPDAVNIAHCCAPNVIRQINMMCKDKIRISPNTKRYGLNINSYIGGPLQVDLVSLPLLKDSVTRGWGWLIDFTRIKQKDIDRPTFFPDAKNVGESEIIYDTYREVTSLLVANESRHSMHVGATL